MYKCLYLNMVSAALAAVAISFSASAAETTILQHEKSFRSSNDQPLTEYKIKVGDVIEFRNEDPFFHNVFSLSDIKSFDLGSYPKGQSRKVTFDKPGTVDVECAIHANMQLRIEVTK